VQVPKSAADDPGFAIALVRILSLSVAWAVLRWRTLRGQDVELLEHLQTPNCMALMVTAAAGTLLHAACAWQQYLVGARGPCCQLGTARKFCGVPFLA